MTERELLKLFADAVEEVALAIPAPNAFTPRLMQLCVEVRSRILSHARADGKPETRVIYFPSENLVEALGSILAIARTIKEEYRTPSEVEEIEKASLVYREALYVLR